jgi:hypothetical protein
VWLLTTDGFFSIVEKPDDREAGTLTIRARTRADLDRLREEILPELGPSIGGQGAEYPFRARVSRAACAEGMKRMVERLDYPSFKNAVFTRQGPHRARVYGKVWRDLIELEDESALRLDVQSDGRIARRLARTVVVFHQRHGHWPTRIGMPKGYFDVLLLDVGQIWHKPMLEKLRFCISEQGIRAMDDAGHQVDDDPVAFAEIDPRDGFTWMFG